MPLFIRRVILLAAVAAGLLAGSVCFAEGVYPQIDVSGFKKWENKSVSVNNSRNYFNALSQLGGYYPTFTGGPWQERLQLRILGQLSEDLSVGYDLEQQPETPERYDVNVKYGNSELTFGDINASFAGNEFVSTSKTLNGVLLSSKGGWFDLLAVPSAKLKSQTQGLASQKGNNTRGPYNLGHGSIVEGSEQIQLNNVLLRRNTDYIIDYFEGKITFNKILNNTDEFKYSYEFTNLLDLFFPSLSKRDFLGFQSRFTIDPDKFGKPEPQKEPVTNAARDAFPSAGSVEAEVQETESSGQYQLKKSPVVKFSEVLTFLGVQLKKNEDYVVRYDTGDIKLLTKYLPTTQEALAVEYKYYQTELEAETLTGIGSRGPYRTKFRNIVPESEAVELDGKQSVRDLDYTIKNDSGDLLFGAVVGTTSQIKITYRHIVLSLPPVSPILFPKELKLGVTYLKESAKKGTNSPTSTVIENYSGQTIINGNYALALKNRPVVSSAEGEVSIRLNHAGAIRELTAEVDYTFPTTEVDSSTGFIRVIPNSRLSYVNDRTDPTNGRTAGTVYFYNQTISPSDEVTIMYAYKKSVVGKYNSVGNGSVGPYYLRNIRDLVPGSETVQVWDQGSSVITAYTRNPSFDATAGQTGYSINYNSANPSLTFNSPFPAAKNFQIIYQYVPPTTSNNDIAQSALGLDGSFKIGDAFKIDSSFARSENDQVFTAASTTESFNGNGAKNYSLHSPAELIEGSEQLYVNQRLLNRDIDFFINYTAPGSINFFYISPATLDAIAVSYNYKSASGGEVGANVKTDTAFRLGGETKIFGDVLTLNGTAKKVGFDFSPLGGTAIGAGAENQDYNLNFKPSFQDFSTQYSYKFNKTPIGSSRLLFLRTYDNSVTSGFNPRGLARIDFNYRSFTSIDDLASPEALHNSDSQQASYGLSLAPSDWRSGQLVLTQKYEARRTTSKNDFIDRGAALSTSDTSFWRAGNSLKLTDRFTFSLDYQQNEPVSLGSLETQTAHSRAVDSTYNFSLDLTSFFLQKWLARVSIINHIDANLLTTSETSSLTQNETYHMDLIPFAFLTGALDHNRQEKTTFLAGGVNPLSLRTTGSTRLSPVSWFSLGFSGTRNENIPETGDANKTTGKVFNYDADYTPLSSDKISINSRFALNNSVQTAPLGAETVRTNTDTFSQNYSMKLNPFPILPLTFGLVQEDYKNINASVTSPVSTETQNQTFTAGLTLSLPSLPQLSIGADYNQKYTKNLKTGESRPKTLTNAKLGYQITNWGTVAWDFSEERNFGEVQAGSVVNLNIRKQTQTLSLNIAVPINNPVLQNFNMLASLKTVTYNNYDSALDDFTVSLLSLEGTLNF